MKKTIAEKQNNLALLLLYGVCFVTAVSAAGFIWITTDRILSQYEAREFLGTIDRIPGDSFHVLLWVSACMVFLGMSFLLRLRLKGRGERLIFWSLLFDFIVGFCAVAVLDFNYNGILLWVFANILVYVRKNRFWPIITGVGILSYTFTGFELISIRMRVFDIADYIHVYGSSTQMYLFGVWNFLEILTLVSFIGCCLVIRDRHLDSIFLSISLITRSPLMIFISRSSSLLSTAVKSWSKDASTASPISFTLLRRLSSSSM